MNVVAQEAVGTIGQAVTAAAGPGCTDWIIAWHLDGPRPERTARRLVASVLAGLGIAEDTAYDAEVAVDELVANAISHAPLGYELRVTIGRGSIKVAVSDGGSDHEALAARLAAAAGDTPSLDEYGHGLQMIAGLFPCGVEQARSLTGVTTAKQVWIEVARPRRGSTFSPFADQAGTVMERL